jgi:hypothetical protein
VQKIVVLTSDAINEPAALRIAARLRSAWVDTAVPRHWAIPPVVAAVSARRLQ